ncbi:hypothetical protein LPJ61_002898 [Coemansia biformis]|uniref:Metallo-beta-lactamase domain-containing protein n=1 Tax=Coemansia biformis TaxID=1286918 RepID=A0A9W7YC81_9FUNG|nr:hypothetical protein LPJ61_002898 [Coemansia biformis]
MPAETRRPSLRVTSIIFMGTGTSGCIPNVPCITSDNPKCKVCKYSLTAEGAKNRRRNTSLLVCVSHPDGRQRNILIDCGKTFYEAAVDVFVKHNIKTIDAVILTHGHADAMMGLDSLRQWTALQKTPLPIFCDNDTLRTIACAFPYLVDTDKATGSGYVPQLEFHTIDEPYAAFECMGIMFQPLRVEHGTHSDGCPYYCNGFRFGNVSYISDCSRIPDSTRPLIEGTELLILDALTWAPYSSHFGYYQALDEVRFFRPSRTLLTDFSHRMSHAEMEQKAEQLLADEGLVVDPSFDGLKVDL